MALIDWNDSYSVGVKEMDDQHKTWIGIINKLNEAMKTGKTKEVLGAILKEMEDYTVYHFSAEEKLVSSHGWIELAAHKPIHTKFTEKIKQLCKEFESGKMLMSLEVMTSLKDWLTNHIVGNDKKYGQYLNSKGIK